MRAQVSAELLIVIAALAALAIYVFTQMRGSAERVAGKLEEKTGDIESLLDEIAGS